MLRIHAKASASCWRPRDAGQMRIVPGLLLAAFAVALIAVRSFGASPGGTPPPTITPPPSGSIDATMPAPYLTLQQRIDRERYELNHRGLQFGVPRQGLRPAVEQMRAMEAAQSLGALTNSTGGATWTAIGPQPMNNQDANFGGFRFGPKFTASGRVSAIALDASGDIFVGAASGGVWYSTDHGATFRSIGDKLPTQAIGSLAFDSANSSPPALYVGTGEGNNFFGGDSTYGQGLFKTTDLGDTWTRVNPGEFNGVGPYQAFTTFSPACQNFYAGTGNGRSFSRTDAGFVEGSAGGSTYESLDSGLTWHRTRADPATGGAIRSLSPGEVFDPTIGELSTGIFAGFDGNGSVAGGIYSALTPCVSSFSFFSPVTNLVSTKGRSSVVSARDGTGATYAMIGSDKGDVYKGFFASFDGGGSWTRMKTPCAETTNSGARWSTATCGTAGVMNQTITLDGSTAGPGPIFSQSIYDQNLEIAPGDHNVAYFGGVGIYRTTDSGATWTFLGAPGGVHSDQHAIVFDPTDSSKVYVGNDGGIFLLNSGAGDTWTSLNETLNTGQIQGIGPDPQDDNRALAGFQDNGTQLYTGALGWTGVDTADGGMALIDPTNPLFAYHTFASTNGMADLARSTDGGNTWTRTLSIRPVMGVDTAAFYPPLAVDPATAKRVLIGGHGIYVSTDAMATWQRQSNQNLTGCLPAGSACALSDIEFAPSDHTRAYALSQQTGAIPFQVWTTSQATMNSGAHWTRIDGALPFDKRKTQGTSIGINPSDPRDAYLSVSGFKSITGIGHVFRTRNSGAAWANATGNLPDVPVEKVMVEREDSSGNTVLIGTDVGVFRSTNGGTNWSPFNQGVIPNVPVLDLEQNRNATIFAATHGRGAYKMIQVAVVPLALQFANQRVGSQSATKQVFVDNPLDTSLTMNIAIVGSNRNDFIQTATTCESTQPAHSICTISIAFKPHAAGARKASLGITDSPDDNSPHRVVLAGTGT